MYKFYFRLLFISLITLLSINILSFIAGFNNGRQLINPSFFDERVVALFYLTKEIVLETGVNLKETPDEDIEIFIDKAADIYNVDSNLLFLLISKKHQYSLTLTGGMGLTTISTYDFIKSSFSNPYNSEENIMAAAETISKLQEEGFSVDDIIMRFIVGKNIKNTKILAKYEYNRALDLIEKYKIETSTGLY